MLLCRDQYEAVEKLQIALQYTNGLFFFVFYLTKYKLNDVQSANFSRFWTISYSLLGKIIG